MRSRQLRRVRVCRVLRRTTIGNIGGLKSKQVKKYSNLGRAVVAFHTTARRAAARCGRTVAREMNAYELERAARIETNKQRMRAMGLGQGGALRVAGLADAPTAALVHLDASGLAGPTGSAPKWNKGKGGLKRTSQETVAPARSTRRQRGIDTEGTQTDTPKPVVSYAEGNDEQQAKRRGTYWPFPNPADCLPTQD